MNYVLTLAKSFLKVVLLSYVLVLTVLLGLVVMTSMLLAG